MVSLEPRSALEELEWDAGDTACEAHFAAEDRITHPGDVDHYRDSCRLHLQVESVARAARKSIAAAFGS